MTPEGRETLEEMRVWALAAPALRKILAERKKIALEVMIRDFRLTGKSSEGHSATIAVIDELERDINAKELAYNTMMETKK